MCSFDYRFILCIAVSYWSSEAFNISIDIICSLIISKRGLSFCFCKFVMVWRHLSPIHLTDIPIDIRMEISGFPQQFETDQSPKHGLFRPDVSTVVWEWLLLPHHSTWTLSHIGEYSERLWAAYPATRGSISGGTGTVLCCVQTSSHPPQGALLRRVKRCGVKLTTFFHLVPRVRTSGSVHPLPRTSSWRDASLNVMGYISTDLSMSWIRILSCRSKFINIRPF